MALRWRRPADVPRGQVWSRFRGKERDGRPALLYQIRDMGETDRKQCLDMMQEVFLRDEPLCRALDITADPVSVATIRSNWEAFADQGVCVACYTEEQGEAKELVGFNILVVKTRDDEDEDPETVKGEPWKKLLRTLTTAERLVDVFQLFGVDAYLSSSGLTVLPEHRGQNIGARLIDARRQICKACDIRAACTVFTASSSQALAAKCGYRALAELPYDAALRAAAADAPSALLMAIQYT